MISKEWWEARWKFALGALAFLALVSIAPSSYEVILNNVEREIQMMQSGAYLESAVGPEEMPEQERRTLEAETRNEVEGMQRPAYPVNLAGWQVRDTQEFGNYAILVPLAGLLGVALISGEVGRGTIFLLLSKPLTRTRILLTKYALGVVILFVVALLGGVGMIASAYAHGYPQESFSVTTILASAALFWLGSLFVLGVALLASVLLRDVIKSIIATVATLWIIVAFPDLLRGVVSWFLWTERDFIEANAREMDNWYGFFEKLRITNYWSAQEPWSPQFSYGSPLLEQNFVATDFLVCLISASVPLLLALWLFNRKTY